MSDFAKSKTLAEQRQYLPIFSVREELLQVGFCVIYVVIIDSRFLSKESLGIWSFRSNRLSIYNNHDQSV